MENNMSKQRRIFAKTLRIISSCKTIEQANVAAEYVKLVYNYFRKIFGSDSDLFKNIQAIISDWLTMNYINCIAYDIDYLVEMIFNEKEELK
jgi:Zn-dependent metalloprotease